MASIEDIPELKQGILYPKFQHRWRLIVLPKVPIIAEIKEQLTTQMISFAFNYHLQTLEMVFEQNANNNHLHTFVKQLSAFSKTDDYKNISFVIEEMDGAHNVNGRFMFSACKLLDHKYMLDYCSSDACTHWIKMSFRETKEL
jgi:hypothetical protein